MYSKLSRSCACSHGRMAVVRRVKHRSIRPGHLHVVRLLMGRLPVALMKSISLLNSLMDPDPTGSAVVANASDVVDHRGVIHVVDIDDVHVGHGAVVKELSTAPVAAVISHAGVAEA